MNSVVQKLNGCSRERKIRKQLCYTLFWRKKEQIANLTYQRQPKHRSSNSQLITQCLAFTSHFSNLIISN
uniref:Uncharacterized protein n=1 Tax=Rhizophora mucronata TaxID=61149 RepID=A0A2P2NS27_RHIMU